MQTEQTMTAATVFPAVQSSGKIGYPTNRLISVFDDWKSLNRAIVALAETGVDQNAIEVLSGPRGIQRLGAERSGGRLLGWLERRLPELGPERELLNSYRADLRSGRLLLVVRHPQPLPHAILHLALTINGGHATHFFGRFAVHILAT